MGIKKINRVSEFQVPWNEELLKGNWSLTSDFYAEE